MLYFPTRRKNLEWLPPQVAAALASLREETARLAAENAALRGALAATDDDLPAAAAAGAAIPPNSFTPDAVASN